MPSASLPPDTQARAAMLAAMHRACAAAGAQNGQVPSDQPPEGEVDNHQPAGGVRIQRIATIGNRKHTSA